MKRFPTLVLSALALVLATPAVMAAQSDSTTPQEQFRLARAKNAVILIDGVRTSAQKLAKFDLGQIATIKILPETEAVKRFGEAGKRGALLVTTTAARAKTSRMNGDSTESGEVDGWQQRMQN